jgi:hypothetical protein
MPREAPHTRCIPANRATVEAERQSNAAPRRILVDTMAKDTPAPSPAHAQAADETREEASRFADMTSRTARDAQARRIVNDRLRRFVTALTSQFHTSAEDLWRSVDSKIGQEPKPENREGEPTKGS